MLFPPPPPCISVSLYKALDDLNVGVLRFFLLFCFCFWYFGYLWGRVAWNPGWPQNSHLAKEVLKYLIILPPSPRAGWFLSIEFFFILSMSLLYMLEIFFSTYKHFYPIDFFHFVRRVFQRSDIINFAQVQWSYVLFGASYLHQMKENLSNPSSQRIFTYFLLDVLQFEDGKLCS